MDRKPSPEIIDDRRARDTRRDEQWRSPPSNGYEQVHGEVVTKEDAGYIGMSACSLLAAALHLCAVLAIPDDNEWIIRIGGEAN